MMDALIEACVGMNTRRQALAAAQKAGGDEVDSRKQQSQIEEGKQHWP